MINAAVDFLQAFVDGIADNSDKLAKSAVDIIQTLITSVTEHAPDLIKAAKVIVSELVDNLSKLLPKELQKPVKEAISTIQKSFESGGLKKAIENVKNIVVNLGKAFTNVAKVVLPPLSKAVDFLADKFDVLLPIVTSLYAAFKTYAIISTVTSLVTAHTAAVTAESLAEAASLGTITLKQIAVGALTGEITLATAAQYAWNLAMSLNPIGIVVAAVAALTAGITIMCGVMSDSSNETSNLEIAQEKLKDSNQRLGESYEEIGGKFTDFLEGVENAGSIFDNFNEEIIISEDEKQELSDNMNSVQKEITDVCSTAAEERRKLTGDEISRLDELFQKCMNLQLKSLQLSKRSKMLLFLKLKHCATLLMFHLMSIFLVLKEYKIQQKKHEQLSLIKLMSNIPRKLHYLIKSLKQIQITLKNNTMQMLKLQKIHIKMLLIQLINKLQTL